MIAYDANLKFYYSDKINDDVFFSAFCTKKTIFSSFLKEGKIARMNQVHDDKIKIVEKIKSDDEIYFSGTDGLICRQRKTVLTAYTADCVPIIYADKKSGLFGISHQGWKGTFKKMASKMILSMNREGAKSENIIAAIGPSIGVCCYTIEKKRYDQFKRKFGKYKKVFKRKNGGIFLDLAKLNLIQLMESGVSRNNIDFSPLCTKCNGDKFYSFRTGDKDRKMENLVRIN